MKILIINRNRLTLPRTMAEWLAERNLEVVFIDNASDYPPLLEYYHTCPFEVVRLSQNFGHTVVWGSSLLADLKIRGRYVVTDPDLSLSGLPGDFMQVLGEGLDRHALKDKCALSLEINDLPDSLEGNFIRKHEAKYWKTPLDSGYFLADTDTTFALYREGVTEYNHNAIRSARPYTARHIPWYYTDFKLLPEDERYYFETANESCSGKKRLLP